MQSVSRYNLHFVKFSRGYIGPSISEKFKGGILPNKIKIIIAIKKWYIFIGLCNAIEKLGIDTVVQCHFNLIKKKSYDTADPYFRNVYRGHPSKIHS